VEIYNRAGIPARYRDASFLQCTRAASEHPEKARALTSSLQWLSSFRPGEGNRGLVLHGKVGRGKTYMLIALIRQLIFTQGVPVRFIEFTRLLSLLRAGYDEGRSDIPIFDQLSTVPVLAIDELGKGRMTEWELTVIDEVVSRRYNAMACIMATTNFEPREPTPGGPPPVNLAQPDQSNQTLGDRVGARVYSRLREICDFAELGGVDFRTTPLALRG
jgi:DNA replication protein DnaC